MLLSHGNTQFKPHSIGQSAVLDKLRPDLIWYVSTYLSGFLKHVSSFWSTLIVVVLQVSNRINCPNFNRILLFPPLHASFRLKVSSSDAAFHPQLKPVGQNAALDELISLTCEFIWTCVISPTKRGHKYMWYHHAWRFERPFCNLLKMLHDFMMI